MLRGYATTVIVLELMACGKGSGDKAAPAPAPEPTGPIAIRFGDCAAATLGFVSGPRPQPFTPDEAAGILAAKDARRRPTIRRRPRPMTWTIRNWHDSKRSSRRATPASSAAPRSRRAT